MSDENDMRDETTQDEESSGPICGERLAEARRNLQIPVIEIAKELHLDEYKVRALESNDFDVIGAPVFAKGHLRKYAQLVKVDEADVMADYYQLNRSASGQPVLAPRRRPNRTISPGPWVAAIAVILAVASAYWWFVSREPAPERPVAGEIAPLPELSIATPEEDEATSDETDDVVDEEVIAVVEPPTTQPVLDTIDASELQLSITYSDDCWTEITDAAGRRLFFDLGRSGRTVNLSGEAPFNVLFGDAANVSLVVNGSAFQIPAANRRGRTARLTITGP
jgi:cytoskeleton protein RodZ